MPCRRGKGSILGARSGLVVLLAAPVLLLVLMAVAGWLLDTAPPQEAAGQTPPPAPTTASPTPLSASPAPLEDGLEDLFGDAFEDASASAEGGEPQGIPDLGIMDVIGNIEDLPVEGVLICDGPIAGDGGRTVWVCSSPEDDARPWYSLVVVGDDPLTISSVQATIRGASDGQAATFFAQVGYRCVDETDPFNPEAWVRENVPTGGQTFAEGVELSVYGTREARTLQVVASETF